VGAAGARYGFQVARLRQGDLTSARQPLGLYGEEIDPAANRHLGNDPQALIYAALLQAALSLRGP
jgi:GH15 family glucan-1,4-alpha-glucosidase